MFYFLQSNTPYFVNHLPSGDNLEKGVQCYELFGGIALKNHTFSFFSVNHLERFTCHYEFRTYIYIYIYIVLVLVPRVDSDK